MLERLKHLRTVDIYGQVTCLRAQRNYMVQTEDQYVFIHDAVLEAIQSGNTEIPARGLYAHVHRMSERPADSLTGATGIQLEYRVSQYSQRDKARTINKILLFNGYSRLLFTAYTSPRLARCRVSQIRRRHTTCHCTQHVRLRARTSTSQPMHDSSSHLVPTE